MTEYRAPTREIVFTLQHVAGFSEMVKACGYEEASEDVVRAILEEAARFSTSVIAPTNAVGDRQGVKLDQNGVVKTPPEGFREAYQQYADSGWASLQFNLNLRVKACRFLWRYRYRKCGMLPTWPGGGSVLCCLKAPSKHFQKMRATNSNENYCLKWSPAIGPEP